MSENVFMPKGLPLLSDATLLRTLREYGRSYAALGQSVFPSTARLRRTIGLAMLSIEQELEARCVPIPPQTEEITLPIGSGLARPLNHASVPVDSASA